MSPIYVVPVVLMLTGTVISYIVNKPILKVNDERCHIEKLGTVTIEECDSDIDDLGFIEEGGICWITVKGTLITSESVNHITHLKCLDGDWLSTGNLPKHKRIKRGWWRRRSRSSPPVYVTRVVIKPQKPPKFDTCRPADLQQEFLTASGQTSVVVTWITPVAIDPDSSKAPTVILDTGPPSGSSFEGTVSGKQHTIRYIATDSDGLTAYCYFSFVVKIPSCSHLAWPSNGYVDCPNGHYLGSSCFYNCNDGHNISGDETVTCENAALPMWSTQPTCDIISCTVPTTLTNGFVECEDTSYPYSSVCTYNCNDGYRLLGKLYVQCEADGQWTSSDQPTCIDDIAPTLTCVTPQMYYADRGLSTTTVTWQLPTVTDSVDTTPTLVQTEGPVRGSTLGTGTTIVKYTATDLSGNEAPECTIELRVEEIMCSHPLDTLNDIYMVFDCFGLAYKYGDRCTLSCNFNFPLNGTDIITCEKEGPDDNPTGVWDWGTGHQPICEEIECPVLNPPLNGALIDNSFKQRPLSTIVCHENFDIPELATTIPFSGQFFCYDDGTWGPLSYVPDCSEERNPRFISLPSEIFYFSGDCNTEETQEQIRQNFNTIFSSTIAQLCPTGETCYIGAMTIRCGPTSGRKRRYINAKSVLQQGDNSRLARMFEDVDHLLNKREAPTHILEMSFRMNVLWNRGNMTLRNAYDHYDAVHAVLKEAVQSLVDDGSLSITGFILESDSFQTDQYSSLVCDDNQYLVVQKGYCVSCPAGHYLKDNTCAQCPVGSYMDKVGSVQCKSCPDRYTTRTEGSKSSTDCLVFCSPGYYSPDGLAKCSACPVGTYQDQHQSTNCTQCPIDTTTLSTNSLLDSDCQNFDVRFSGAFGQAVKLANLSNPMHDMVVMFWAKPQGLNTNMALQVTSRSSDFIKIHLTTDIRVEILSTESEIVGSFVSTSWTHIAVSTRSTSSSVSVYINGVLVHEFAGITQSTPYIENGAVVVTSTETSDVHVSGFYLRNETVSLSTIESHSQACHVTFTYDVISMDVYRTMKTQGISAIVPSVCDAIDDCISSPCGNHTCINEVGGFTCICSGGYTGVTCTILPDYCINNDCVGGATCQSGSTNYTCLCHQGYSGTFCEIAPVDGGWSNWSTWPECDVTCGSGTQSRVRSCDSPAPGEYGRDCVGKALETVVCNTDKCRVCPILRRNFGTLLNCSTNSITGTQTCSPYCKDGLLIPKGINEFDAYRCGLDTKYKWEPLDKVPRCGDAHRPESYVLQVTVSYISTISNNDTTLLKNAVEANAAKTTCGQTSTCQIYTELMTYARRRRSTDNTLRLSFEISLARTGSLQFEHYSTNGTVSPGLQEVIDASTVMETTAAYINTSSSSIFDFMVDGVTYVSDVDSLRIDDLVMCEIGQATTTERLCVPCPVGTYVSGSTCRFCDVGSYQPTPGQLECLTCPAGLTSLTIGSTDMSQCLESSTSTEHVVTTALHNHNKPIEGTTDPETMGMYIGIGIAGIALLLSLVAMAIVCFKKQGKGPFRSNSVSNFNNFRPRTGPSTMAIFPSPVTGASTTNTIFYHANKSTKPDILTMDDVENTDWTPTTGSPPPPYCHGDGNMSINGVATP